MSINTRTWAVFAGALLIVAILANVASAHDTWLLPSRFEVAPNERVTLDLTSGMAFPENETGPKRERVENAKARLAGRTFDIPDIAPAAKSLVFTATLPEAGVAALWVQLPPKSIELKPEQVEEYLEEIGAPESVQKEWQETEPQRWREFYTKHQKTFVRVGDPQSDRSWSEPVGTGLEIIPERDPTALREGEEFVVRVLKNGKPHADFALNAVAAGGKKGETRRTDANGRAVFRLNKAGAWLLRGTDLRKSTRDDADWESDFVTLTFDAKAKQ